MSKVRNFLSEIVVEPIAVGYVTVVVILMFTSNELYLEKACKVNLNYTIEVCEHLNGPNNSLIQVEVQKYVSEVQAYNGIIQSLPTIVFAFFMGPISDRYGRKPLILMGLSGATILSLVFLINSIWFFELKVSHPTPKRAKWSFDKGLLSLCRNFNK